MSKKVLAFDMDGTIVADGRYYGILNETIEALKVAKKKGYIIGIATGRPYEDIMRDIKDEFNDLFDFYIPNNGAHFYDNKTKTFHYDTELPWSIVKKVYEVGQKYETFFAIHAEGKAKRSQLSNKKVDFDHPEFIEFKKFDLSNGKDLMEEFEGKKVQQVSLRSSAEVIKKLAKEFKDEKGKFDIHIANDVYLDVNPLNTNKLNGLIKAGKHFNFSVENVIAFGDSGNDIDMLKGVGLGISMGNGNVEAKAAADEVIGDNNSNAIALKIYKLLEDK